MIGKDLDELCYEFGTLSPHQRIDVLSGLLEMCLGPELRFIGSVVVDLCKKDYIYLREQENKANKPEELTSLKQNPTDIKNLQQTMALNLALLHTDNTHCASIVFDILENNMKQAFSITTATEKESVDIILLVLTMAMRHPAFTFYQRTELYKYYMCVKKQLESVLCKVRNRSDRGSITLQQKWRSLLPAILPDAVFTLIFMFAIPTCYYGFYKCRLYADIVLICPKHAVLDKSMYRLFPVRAVSC